MTIRLKDLFQIVKDYQAEFPDWKIMGKSSIIRESGAILQGILFNRSDDDVYRPTGFIRILTAPEPVGIMELAQPLRYPNGAPDRRVRLKNHDKELDEIVRELRRQIIPAIDQALETTDVLKLYEREAIPTAPEAYSIATLHAYLGHAAKSRRWCDRFRELLHKRSSLTEVDHERSNFLNTLEAWLDRSEARVQLDIIIQQERQKLGLS